jgi:hypothetical protein
MAAVVDPRILAVVALVAAAPLVIVFVVALVRSYEITIHFRRGPTRGRDR